MATIPCPFVYSTRRPCPGHVVRVEAYKAELVWSLGADGVWSFAFAPRSHWHLFCSLKGNHAGSLRPDDPQMKFRDRELPLAVEAVLDATGVAPAPDQLPDA